MATKKKKTKKERELSMDPADFEVGGLLDDFDGRITEVECVTWDYDGKSDVDSPALKLTIDPDEADEQIVYLSAGDLKRVKPKRDGTTFVAAPNSTAKSISKTSNAALFLASLINAGFPAKLLGNLKTALTGLYAHFVRVPQPKRTGLADDEEGQTRTVLNVSEIHEMPGKGKLTKKKKATKKKKKDEDEDEEEEEDDTDDEEEEDEDEDEDDSDDDEEEEDDDDEEDEDEDEDDAVSEETEKAILALLKTAKFKKGIPADDLATTVYQKVRSSKNKKAILELAQDDDWLGDSDRAFKFDGKKVTAKKRK